LSARDALTALIAGRRVECQPVTLDRHGRTVARWHAGGQDLGVLMVASGWAWAFARYSLDFVSLESEARASGLGVHARRPVDPVKSAKKKRTIGIGPDGADRGWRQLRPRFPVLRVLRGAMGNQLRADRPATVVSGEAQNRRTLPVSGMRQSCGLAYP
jgi:hypothetical protein